MFYAANEFVAGRVQVYATRSNETGDLIYVRRGFVVHDFLRHVRVVVVRPLAMIIFAAQSSVTGVSALRHVMAIVFRGLVDFVRVAFVIAREYEDLVVRRRLRSFASDVLVRRFRVGVEVQDGRIRRVIF